MSFERGPFRVFRAFGLDTRWLEVGSGITAALWAIGLLIGPDDLVDHPGYVPLGRFAPDWIWTAAALAAGLIQIAASGRNHVEARILAAIAVGSLYVFLADGLRLGAPWSPSIPLYLGFAVDNAVVMLVLTFILLRDDRRR